MTEGNNTHKTDVAMSLHCPVLIRPRKTSKLKMSIDFWILYHPLSKSLQDLAVPWNAPSCQVKCNECACAMFILF